MISTIMWNKTQANSSQAHQLGISDLLKSNPIKMHGTAKQ